jgi:hypothetical protein
LGSIQSFQTISEKVFPEQWLLSIQGRVEAKLCIAGYFIGAPRLESSTTSGGAQQQAALALAIATARFSHQRGRGFYPAALLRVFFSKVLFDAEPRLGIPRGTGAGRSPLAHSYHLQVSLGVLGRRESLP